MEVTPISREEFAGTGVEKALLFRDACLRAILEALDKHPDGIGAVELFGIVQEAISEQFSGREYSWEALEHHVRLLESAGAVDADQGVVVRIAP